MIVSSRDFARMEFLRAIKSHAPAVLSSLESDVLPLYESFNSSVLSSGSNMTVELAMLPESLAEMARLEGVSGECREKEYAALPAPYQPYVRFEIALCKWGRCYHITDDWIFSEALKTLEIWHRSDVHNDWACASEAYVPGVEMYEDDKAFNFTFDPWDAAVDTRASYEKKVSEAFNAWLEDYCERVEASHGGKVKAYDSKKLDHYVWLVEHQINGLRYADIAENHQGEKGLDLRNISEAINRLANMIRLTLRPARRRSANP